MPHLQAEDYEIFSSKGCLGKYSNILTVLACRA